MADSSTDSYFSSDIFGLRQISSSFPSIPSLIVGSCLKGHSDSDSLRSPTSPLDFKFFSNLSRSFNLKSPRSSGSQKKWDTSEVGLGIVNSIASEVKSTDETPILQHKHIIFGCQVKNISPLDQNCRGSELHPVKKSNSLPRNYTVLPETKFGSPEPILRSGDVSFRKEVSLKNMDFCRSRSLDTAKSCSSIVQKPNFSGFCPEDSAARTISETSLDVQGSSLPIPVGSSNEHLTSISSGEIESSEDYTCIISYGPNSKTTHIFCDCVLECYTSNNASCLARKECEAGMTRAVESNEQVETHSSEALLKLCSSCKRELTGTEEIHKDGCVKSFCSGECQAKNIEQTDEYSENSSELSYLDDLFFVGTPFATQ
ncbi:hypothetical protein SAY87_005977 [Trapa incisa]|uniref:FLZ-type domain-containing protein n=1 Tax=Trapa incisa TaxID=236973 RepID=A0AAN7K9U3_9MYRT|nr:hypothetical protein SAY87_005977 [Trapa incisa]